MMRRRQFVIGSGALMLFGPLAPRRAAADPTSPKLSLWILRGGLDGLAAVPPWSDPDYPDLRRQLALPKPGQTDGSIDLDGRFGLHPALPYLAELYARGQLLPVHAVATPYRDRSHFDGQKVLENGTAGPAALSGWLNRLLELHTDKSALAIGGQTPLVVRGDRRVASWAPSVLPPADDDTLDRIAALYAGYEEFAARFEQARNASALQAAGLPVAQRPARGANFPQLAVAAARFMREANGPDITVLEANGWDTHANQGGATGQLANRLRLLDDSISQFEQQIGPAWLQTIVVIVTEFGRTTAPNGTNGTDHGTAGIAMLAGGAVNGGRVLADWPGLGRRDLHERRDLRPTVDLRAILKGVLADHLATRKASLDETIFPNSSDVPALADLVRTG